MPGYNSSNNLVAENVPATPRNSNNETGYTQCPLPTRRKHVYTPKGYEPKNRKAFTECLRKIKPFLDEDGFIMESHWAEVMYIIDKCRKADGGPGFSKEVLAAVRAEARPKGGKKTKKNSGKKTRRNRRN